MNDVRQTAHPDPRSPKDPTASSPVFRGPPATARGPAGKGPGKGSGSTSGRACTSVAPPRTRSRRTPLELQDSCVHGACSPEPPPAQPGQPGLPRFTLVPTPMHPAPQPHPGPRQRSPSWSMPTRRHLVKRQAWQALRLRLVISHCWRPHSCTRCCLPGKRQGSSAASGPEGLASGESPAIPGKHRSEESGVL